MAMDKLLDVIHDSPIIPGIKSGDGIAAVATTDAKVVFTLYGSVSTISSIVHQLKGMGKFVFVNIDLVDGFSGKTSIIDFMADCTEADGIISSKASLLRYAKEKGFFTIHRFFVVDSASYRNIKKQLENSQADIINIVPGWPKTVQWAVEEFSQPVIAAGLVCDKPTVIENLSAGAIAICSTNCEVWEI